MRIISVIVTDVNEGTILSAGVVKKIQILERTEIKDER